MINKAILLEPNDRYTHYIQTSLHYLNDPKFLFNEDIHGIGRMQGEQALIGWLRHYKYPKPITTARLIMKSIVVIPYQQFHSINENTYLGKSIAELPYYCQKTHSKLESAYKIAKLQN